MTVTAPTISKFSTLADTDSELTKEHLQKLQLYLYTVNNKWPDVFVIEKYSNGLFVLYDTNGCNYKFLLQNNNVILKSCDSTTSSSKTELLKTFLFEGIYYPTDIQNILDASITDYTPNSTSRLIKVYFPDLNYEQSLELEAQVKNFREKALPHILGQSYADIIGATSCNNFGLNLTFIRNYVKNICNLDNVTPLVIALSLHRIKEFRPYAFHEILWASLKKEDIKTAGQALPNLSCKFNKIKTLLNKNRNQDQYIGFHSYWINLPNKDREQILLYKEKLYIINNNAHSLKP